MNYKLTVLMAVNNGVPYLRTAVESILNQTYRDFRFLIIDDASTDESREIVRSYVDDRIELVCLERNVGQTAALNFGLRRIKTPWIARMDADDCSASARLEEQMKALEADPSLSCLGTFCWIFHSDPIIVDGIWEHPIHYEDIKRGLLTGCPMTHGSLVISRKILLEIGGYDERYRLAADIDLYDRLLKGHRAANLPRLLYGCRLHPGQRQGSRLSLEESLEIWRKRLEQNQYNPEDAALVRTALSGHVVGRVRYLWEERKYRASLKNLCWAFRLSPKSVTRWYLGNLAHTLMPRHLRAVVRRLKEPTNGRD